MSFPRYQNYKRSGVEWLGDVPAHWSLSPLKRDLAYITSGSRGWADNYSDSGSLFIRIANLTRDRIELDLTDVQRVAVPEGAEGVRTRVRAGDILFSITAYLGSTAIVPDGIDDAYVSQHVALARLRSPSSLPRWIGYVALSDVGRTWFDMQSYGGTKIQLSLDDVRELPVPRPPVSEQAAIVSFLDRETAKIDALVAEQERLIELLKEKRQAAISHAVTKGLNPDAPMKPSGVEWLGNVPAHWTTLQVSKVVDAVADGPHFSPNYVDEGVPFLSARNVRLDGWSLDDVKFVSELDCATFDQRVVPQVGDVLYTKGGTTGVARAVDLPFRFQVWVHIAVLKLRKCLVDADYMAFALNSVGCYEQSQLLTRGATNNDLGLTRLIKIWFALPPLQEQQEIVKSLEARTLGLDALANDATRGIELLRERRSALVSAAITGQIDVRNHSETPAA